MSQSADGQCGTLSPRDAHAVRANKSLQAVAAQAIAAQWQEQPEQFGERAYRQFLTHPGAVELDRLYVIIIVLALAIGSTMCTERFPTVQTIEIAVLGLIAFLFGTASGVSTAKVTNLFLETKINPMIGSAVIACVPIAARVPHIVAHQENPNNYLIYQAMGPKIAEVRRAHHFSHAPPRNPSH